MRQSASAIWRRPWRVLLVDDDGDARGLCADYLTGAGYEIAQADNGARAVDLAIEGKPDVIVMDLEMPVMGGVEAIRCLGADARTRAIPVIVLSANGALDHARVKRLGCDICLVKPCDPWDLEGIIRSLVDRARLPGRGSAPSRR